MLPSSGLKQPQDSFPLTTCRGNSGCDDHPRLFYDRCISRVHLVNQVHTRPREKSPPLSLGKSCILMGNYLIILYSNSSPRLNSASMVSLPPRTHLTSSRISSFSRTMRTVTPCVCCVRGHGNGNGQRYDIIEKVNF